MYDDTPCVMGCRCVNIHNMNNVHNLVLQSHSIESLVNGILVSREREREKKKSKKKMKDLLLTVVLGGGLFGMGL